MTPTPVWQTFRGESAVLLHGRRATDLVSLCRYGGLPAEPGHGQAHAAVTQAAAAPAQASMQLLGCGTAQGFAQGLEQCSLISLSSSLHPHLNSAPDKARNTFTTSLRAPYIVESAQIIA